MHSWRRAMCDRDPPSLPSRSMLSDREGHSRRRSWIIFTTREQSPGVEHSAGPKGLSAEKVGTRDFGEVFAVATATAAHTGGDQWTSGLLRDWKYSARSAEKSAG